MFWLTDFGELEDLLVNRILELFFVLIVLINVLSILTFLGL